MASLRIAAARFRFFLLLGAVVAVMAAWPTLRNLWDKLTGPAGMEGFVSPGIEYWCPMCPGVASDWPGQCPVCHMALVRRKKGEMTPLPDGAVARMQFPPYRVQLAGIHTSPVEYRPLVREVILAGLLEGAEARGAGREVRGEGRGARGEEREADKTSSDDLGRLALATDVFESDIGLFRAGQMVDMTSETFPGQTFKARVTRLAAQVSPNARSVRVRLEVDNPRKELRRGMYLSARVPVPLAGLPGNGEQALESWCNHTTVSLWAGSLASPLGPVATGGLDALMKSALARAALQRGMLLAIPESAVIDTGTRKVVFVEQTPGMFDGVEVWLGRRAGDYFPVLAGLETGQSVVTAGAFLLDAETRLNPAAAASYFGAGSRGGSASVTPTAPLPGSSLEDQKLVKLQKSCPVMGHPLGSMGAPFRMVIEGRVVFLCCEGCAPELKKHPAKYLAKLPK